MNANLVFRLKYNWIYYVKSDLGLLFLPEYDNMYCHSTVISLSPNWVLSILILLSWQYFIIEPTTRMLLQIAFQTPIWMESSGSDDFCVWNSLHNT